MPQHKSAAKRVLTNQKAQQRNRMIHSTMKTSIKKVRAASTKEEAGQALHQATSLIDRTVSKGVIHKYAGARYKSRLVHLVRRMD